MKNKIIIKTDLKSIPNKMHLEVQIKTKCNVFKNKKNYTRKQKYKNLGETNE